MTDITLKDNQSNNRYIQLDSLRGLAALSVFFWHVVGILPRQPILKQIINSPLSVAWNGASAVIFFFLLSGFVLSLPFINNSRSIHLTEFYFKRFLRIYPVFIFCLILGILAKYIITDQLGQPYLTWIIKDFWQWRFTHAIKLDLLKTMLLIGPTYNSNLIDPAIWSLSVEMLISLSIPFFIIIVSKGNAIFNLIFCAFILYVSRNSSVMFYFSPFYIGILLARYRTEIITYFKNLNKILLVAIGIIGVLLYTSNLTLVEKKLPLIIVAFGSALLMMLVLSSDKLSKFLSNRYFKFIGDISYGFYLIHMPVQFLFCSIFYMVHYFSPLAIILSSLITSIILSWLMHKGIEKPIQKFVKYAINHYNFFKTIDLR
jgi:peptidoglycan/LPS O-acetylase OafA/YrhL